MLELSNAELEYMRDSIDELLPDTCNILSQSYAADGQGGGTITWGTATANVPCRIDPIKTQKDELTGQAIRDIHNFQLTVSYDVVLTSKQRIEKGTDLYSVTSVDTGKSWAASKRAFMERVNNA